MATTAAQTHLDQGAGVAQAAQEAELHQVAGGLVGAELLGELEVQDAEEARVDQQARLARQGRVRVEGEGRERRGLGDSGSIEFRLHG